MAILFELVDAFNNRSDQYSLFKVGFFKNKWFYLSILSSVVLAIIVIQVPALDNVFHTSCLNPGDWIIVIVATLTIFPVVEITKWILSRMDKASLIMRL